MSETRPTEQQNDSAVQSAKTGSTLAHLRVARPGSAREVFEVRARGTTIGRDLGDVRCDVRIDDVLMSRRHARIELGAASWQLIDLGSKNGGFVDGRAFAPGDQVELPDGSVIRLGDTLLVFRASPATSGTGDERGAAFPGVSPAAAAVRRRIAMLAKSTGHVLVLGETGTGKERVARAIADLDASHPFVTLNCAELTRDLVRSELFGHVRGAFSGAVQTKPGLIEIAGHDAIFLDEIGELALEIQGDLLRFLEDGSYRPIGVTELRHSNARVIAATNVNLDQAVASSKFRRDLIARLRSSNAPLELPPLRARREDIPGWTRVFFEETGKTFPDEAWTPGALECLLLYPWGENLRELRGVVRDVIAEDVGTPFQTERLPARVRSHRSMLRGASEPERDPGASGASLPPAREPTQAKIEEVLRQAQGRVRSAAQGLGIDRRKLYRLCERFGIALSDYRVTTVDDDD